MFGWKGDTDGRRMPKHTCFPPDIASIPPIPADFMLNALQEGCALFYILYFRRGTWGVQEYAATS